MTLDKVRDEVISKARKREADLIAKAKDEAGRIKRGAQSQVKERQKQVEQELAQLQQVTEAAKLSATELEAQKELLAAKKELLEAVFARATERLDKLSDKERKKHLGALLEKARKEIDVATVYCAKKDVALIGKAKPYEMLGGLIAETKDGNVRVDYSYETLLGALREQLVGELAGVLFRK